MLESVTVRTKIYQSDSIDKHLIQYKPIFKYGGLVNTSRIKNKSIKIMKQLIVN